MANDIEKLIIAHNKDAKNRKLVAEYNQKSQMEKYGVARSETAHSAFLANLLSGNDIRCAAGETPLMWLLNILIEREDNARACPNKIPAEVKQAVLTQALQYNVVEVTPEKKVKLVAPDYFQTNWPSAPVCEDTLDIYIKLRVYNVPGVNYIEIIIENKVLASENGSKSQVVRQGYDNLCQTERYYEACSFTKSDGKLQIFAYLTPDEVGNVTTATDKHFIQISYQDVLDTIITPLLDDDNLTSAQRIELENYVNALNLPTLDVKENKRIVMAITQKAKQDLQDYLIRNKELIKAVLSAVRKNAVGNTLSADENTLVGFAENKRNLFAALGADFANIRTTSFFVIITEDGVSHVECLSSADVAVQYAKLYQKYHPNLNVGELNEAFSSVKGVDNGKTLFKDQPMSKPDTNQPLYTEIFQGIWFENDMWTAAKYSWGKLLNLIASNNLTAKFTYEVC